MTLALACANSEYVVCVSDRRISAGGQPLRDDRSKALVLICGDARVHVAHAGLAETRNFLARDWVASCILEVAPPDYEIQSVCFRLTEALNAQFKKLPVRSDEKRFSLLISGYRYHAREERPQFITAVISNFQDFETHGPQAPLEERAFNRFRTMYWTATPDEDLGLVFGLGQFNALLRDDVDRLQQALWLTSRHLLSRHWRLRAFGALDKTATTHRPSEAP